MSIEEDRKDCWDKLEILAKAIGTIAIPGLLGALLWSWNQERTAADAASRMTAVAIAVLSEPPEVGEGELDPLREWAAQVLRNPRSPPDLSPEAYEALRAGRTIPLRGSTLITEEERLQLLNVAIDGLTFGRPVRRGVPSSESPQ